MKFVADEGVEAILVAILREKGYDVIHILENKSGITDDLVLSYTNDENRILITRDKDFGELVYRDKMIHSGIVLNRLYELPNDKKIEIVLAVIQKYKDELYGSFTVIQPGRVRIRQLRS
ncbi:MAG: DUF5615 family PIN-like protein [Saprospiraceae bacterium]